MRTHHTLTPVALIAMLASASCLHETGEPLTLGQDEEGLDGALVQGTGGVSFDSVLHGETYGNPVLLDVTVPAGVAEVIYSEGETVLGSSRAAASGFFLVHRFAKLGSHVVRAQAFNLAGEPVGEVSADILVVLPASSIAFVSPSLENGHYLNGVWFKVNVEGAPVSKVRYMADQWLLNESSDASSNFAIQYTFTQLGRRTVRAEALAADGTVLATASRTFVVASPAPVGPTAVPYFYQYSNELNPGATCQNTSIAMVLKSLGWQGVPDDITSEYGRFEAQSPGGLAGVFNELAARKGIAKRLSPRTNGTIAGLRAALTSGPVIVHGYMTSFGHVVVVVGFDGTHYTVNDPAGTWAKSFGGGYPHGWEPTAGRGIRYPKAAFELAIGSTDGGSSVNDGSLWYHLLQ